MAKLRGQLFARLALDYFDHPKIMSLSAEAIVAHLEMIVYSRKYGTDGAIPMRFAMRFANEVLTELASNDPEKPSIIRNDDGSVFIHGYEDMQETSDQIAARRQVRREAGKAGANSRWQKDGKSHGKSHSKSNGKKMAETETETETDISKEAIRESRPKKKPPSPEEQHINDVARAGYEAIGKAANFMAIRGIAKWCVNDKGLTLDQFRDACLSVYETGKPITKQTIGQFLDGHLNRQRGTSFDQRANDTAMAVFNHQDDEPWMLEA